MDPDDAASPFLSIELPQFEGPLDLLLHLIQKHELDVLDIPISFVTMKQIAADLAEKFDLSKKLANEILSDALVTTIVKNLKKGNKVYIEGRLQTVDFTLDGREVGLHFVNERDFFNELALIDGAPAAEYVIAVAPSRITFIDRDRARELMFSTPGAAEALARNDAHGFFARAAAQVVTGPTLTNVNDFRAILILPPG